MLKSFCQKYARWTSLGGLAFLTVALPLGAQTAIIEMQDLVVTATRTETPRLLSPVSISSVSALDIAQRPVASVADLVQDLPGVMVADNTFPGMQRLRIRGVAARRSLVLIDGQEISDHTTYGPPLLIDPAFIQRIEVVRGPHSTLFGSRADGGVINIITRGANSDTSGRFVQAGYAGATHGTRYSAGWTGAAEGFDWFVGMSRSEDGDRKTPRGALPDTRHASEGGTARLSWSRENHRVSLLVDHHDMWSEANTPDRVLDGLIISKFHLDLPERVREKVGLTYEGRDLTEATKLVHADVFWQSIDRELTQQIGGMRFPPTRPPTFYDYANADADTTRSWGANSFVQWQGIEGHDVVVGGSWLTDNLDKHLTRTGTHIRAGRVQPVTADITTEAAIGTLAVYLEDTWEFAPQWRLVGGVRQYWVQSELVKSTDPGLSARTDDDARMIGSVGLVHSPREDLSMRVRWNQGYVYPTLLHLHTGSLFAQGNLTRPNPNLRPETSENFEIGLRWENSRSMVDVAAFVNRARNYIHSVRAASLPELGWSPFENTYANLARADATGIEWAASTLVGREGPRLYVQGTYLRREVDFPTYTTTEIGQPRLTGRAGVRWTGSWGSRARWHLDMFGRGGDASALQTTRSRELLERWVTANLAGGVSWGEDVRWSLNVEALNLGDVAYRPSNDELWQPGFHLNVGLRTNF